MCGIAGYINLEGYRDARLIDAMCQVIRHRGPDEQGTWVGEGVALGMRRLSIIDLAGGHQPIFNEDESILVVFNGEIYNYRELQVTLRACGHQFRTDSDTEVIVHAYEEYGDECVKHLRGMFTFALWDRKRQRLLAARDRFGKKPLNYYWDGQQLIFGSEIKSILEAGIPREINHQALDEYLTYRYVPSPKTLFKDVMKVPPAHILVYEDGQVHTSRYWELSYEPTCNDDEETAAERTLALLKDAVQVRLMSEVPLGAFLSGGVDSSVVVALMSELMEQPVKTFSIGFEEDDYSELPYARQVAQRFGTDHHEFLVKPDLIAVLPQLVWAFDEPFADSSMLPTYYVSKLAREHVTVVLSGDGGDEIFSGYQHYAREYAIGRIPPFIQRLVGYGSQFMPDGMRGKRRLHDLLKDYGTRSIQANMILSEVARATMYSPEYFANVRDFNPFEPVLNEYRKAQHRDMATRMQFVDARVYLPDDIMVKVDKASMLNSIETRAPLLDQYLAEYVTSLSPRVRMRNGTLKYLLKKVAADLLPPDILTRRKQGFAAPITNWFSGDLANFARELLDSPRARQRNIFNPEFISMLLQPESSKKLANYGSAIWSQLCLELWFQTYMDQPVSRSASDTLHPVELSGER